MKVCWAFDTSINDLRTKKSIFVTDQLSLDRHLRFTAFLGKPGLACVLLKLESMQDWETAFRDLARQLGRQHWHSNSFNRASWHSPPCIKAHPCFSSTARTAVLSGKRWLQAETRWCMLSTNMYKIIKVTNSWVFNDFPQSPSQPMNGSQLAQNKNLNKKWTWKNWLHWLEHFTTGLCNFFSSWASSVHQRGADT